MKKIAVLVAVVSMVAGTAQAKDAVTTGIQEFGTKVYNSAEVIPAEPPRMIGRLIVNTGGTVITQIGAMGEDVVEAPEEMVQWAKDNKCGQELDCFYKLPVLGVVGVALQTTGDVGAELVVGLTAVPADALTAVAEAFEACDNTFSNELGLVGKAVAGACSGVAFFADAVSVTIRAVGYIGERTLRTYPAGAVAGVGQYLEIPGQFFAGDFTGMVKSGMGGTGTLMCTAFSIIPIIAEELLGAEGVDCLNPAAPYVSNKERNEQRKLQRD